LLRRDKRTYETNIKHYHIKLLTVVITPDTQRQL